MTLLLEVHGHPQLHIPQAEDARPQSVITVGTSFQRAYECKVECCGHATAIVASGELVALREKVTEEAPDAEKVTGSFKSAEGSKEVIIDPGSSKGKTVRIGTTLSPRIGKRTRRLPP